MIVSPVAAWKLPDASGTLGVSLKVSSHNGALNPQPAFLGMRAARGMH